MQDADKKQARELLIKAKIYRILAMGFIGVGAIVFFILYSQYFQGDVVKALKDPMIIIFVIFPFMPSVLLSLKAKKAERELHKLLTSGQ